MDWMNNYLICSAVFSILFFGDESSLIEEMVLCLAGSKPVSEPMITKSCDASVSLRKLVYAAVTVL